MSKTTTLPKPPLFTEGFASADKKPLRRKFSVRLGAGKRGNTWITVDHKGKDPREELLRRIGPLPEDIVQFSRILVAIYQPPVAEKTDGGVYLGEALQTEDIEENLWQGKVGLIVAKGKQAYVDDENVKFHGTANNVGDWVWFRPSDGQAVEVNEVLCRVLFEKDIVGRIPNPDMLF